MIVAPATTSLSLDVQLVDDTGLAVSGLVAATFPATSYSKGTNTAATSITLSDLAAITTAYSSGGVKERSGGFYRLDIPDAALSTAATVRLIGDASGKHLLAPPIEVLDLATAGEIEDLVLDEVLSGSHNVAGSLGAMAQTIYAKTAGLTFTVPNLVDSNPQEIQNDPDACTALRNLSDYYGDNGGLPVFTVQAGAIVIASFAAGAINAAAIAADAITDAKVASDVTIASVTGAVGSVTGAVGSVSGAVGSVTGNVGGNVASVVGAVGSVTVVNDKTGYALSAGGIQAIWDALTSALTTVGSIGKWILDKLDVVLSTRATPAQVNTEADAALADVGLTTTITGRIDAAISSRMATFVYTAPPDATAIQTAAAAALTAYDPPTNAEMEARTLAAASYATAAAVVTAQGTLTKLDGMLVLDGAVYQFTANAVELAPTGGGTAPQNINVEIRETGVSTS